MFIYKIVRRKKNIQYIIGQNKANSPYQVMVANYKAQIWDKTVAVITSKGKVTRNEVTELAYDEQIVQEIINTLI